MKTILGTGRAGFIGSNLCERLLKEKYNVLCIDNLDDNYDPKIKEKNIKELKNNENFKFYKKDIRLQEGFQIKK